MGGWGGGVGGADGCIPLTMLVDACQCCCLLVCMLTAFETFSLLNLVNKESESKAQVKYSRF